MKTTSLSILTAFAVALTACHKGVDRVEVPGGSDGSVQGKQVSTCNSNTNSFRAKPKLTEEKPVTVKIERQFQRVIVKDCSGAVTSDSIQTVRSPRVDFDLKPEQTLSRSATSVRLFDSETCQDKVASLPMKNVPVFGEIYSITGNVDGAIRVKMDMADAMLTFKVTSGWNHIYYTYSDQNEIASGVYNVFVDYSERTLPGETIREATDCGQAK
ncbi:MAG: hypothetical protein EOP04_17140 [Proteobacteria bacterium]|nr:MAG: hypothetical protein EOP04_17140 [Pseudomonadota bacterium]